MDGFIPHKQGQKYKTEKERRKGRLLAEHKYNTKKYHCDVCDTLLNTSQKLRHEKTKKHQLNME